MSYIPDCRTDENYNQKYLNENDKMFVSGYDWAVKEILNMFSNLEVYPELMMLLDEKNLEIARASIEDWAEMQRDELITSMIDAMDDAEYEKIKEYTDGQSEEEDRKDIKTDGT